LGNWKVSRVHGMKIEHVGDLKASLVALAFLSKKPVMGETKEGGDAIPTPTTIGSYHFELEPVDVGDSRQPSYDMSNGTEVSPEGVALHRRAVGQPLRPM
jgi:hypothetical protein